MTSNEETAESVTGVDKEEAAGKTEQAKQETPGGTEKSKKEAEPQAKKEAEEGNTGPVGTEAKKTGTSPTSAGRDEEEGLVPSKTSGEGKDEKKRQPPRFADFVTDPVHSRVLAVSIMLTLFSIAGYLVFSILYTDPAPLYGTSVAFEMSAAVFPPGSMSTKSAKGGLGDVVPSFYVTNFERFPVAGLEVEARIESFSVEIVNGGTLISCDNYPRSLEFTRWQFLCTDVLVGTKAVTDQFGIVDFNDLAFTDKVFPGTYNMSFTQTGNGLTLFKIVKIASDVAQVIVVDPGTTAIDTVDGFGTVYDMKPEVLVLDFAGNPLPNKRVFIFSKSIDGGVLQDYNNDIDLLRLGSNPTWIPDVIRSKLVLTEGNEVVTDANGLATFSNFEIRSSSSRFMYLQILCGGVSTDYWNRTWTPPVAPGVRIPKLMTLEVQPSATVVEGAILPVQPVVKIINPEGTPVVGLPVYCGVVADPLGALPVFFRKERDSIARKAVLNPVATTNAAGEAHFNIAFSTEGPAGPYLLTFGVDGEYLASDAMTVVTTAVAKSHIKWTPPASVLALPYDLTSLPICAAFDTAGNPIQGKNAKLVATPSESIRLVYDNIATAVDGQSLFVFFAIAAAAPGVYELSCEFDGVVSNAISFEVGDTTPRQLAWLELLSYPDVATIPSVQNVTAQPMDQYMQPYSWGGDIVQFALSGPLVGYNDFLSSEAPVLAAGFNDLLGYDLTGTAAMHLDMVFLTGYDASFNFRLYLPGPSPALSETWTTLVDNPVHSLVFSPTEDIFLSVTGRLMSELNLTADEMLCISTDFNYEIVPASYCEIMFVEIPHVLAELLYFGHLQFTDAADGTYSETGPEAGYFTFPNFTLKVPGDYTLAANSQGISSLTRRVVTVPPYVVDSIVVVRQASNFGPIQHGAMISTPPQVQVMSGGSPVEGAYVQVNSENGFFASMNSKPEIGSTIAGPSDASGIVTFTGFGVWFALPDVPVDATVSLVGGGASVALDSLIVDDVSVINILIQPPTTAAVGVPFARDVVIQITNSRGEPQERALVFVAIGDVPDGGGGDIASDTTFPILSDSSVIVLPGLHFTRASNGAYTLRLISPGAEDVYTTTVTVTDLPSFIITTHPRALSTETEVANKVAIETGVPAPFPPVEVYVGEVFPVAVKVYQLSGGVLPNATVTARLIDVDGVSTVKDAADLVYALQKQSWAVLDPLRRSNTSDNSGTCYFNLVIEDAVPGVYTLVFSSGTVFSPPTRRFTVKNHVGKVEIITQPAGLSRSGIVPVKTETTPGEFTTTHVRVAGVEDDVATMEQPVVKVTLTDGTPAANYRIKVAVERLSVDAKSKARSVIGTGAQLLWTEVFTDANGVAVFTDLRFRIAETSIYRLVFSAAGIRSPPSSNFYAINPRLPNANNLKNFEQIVLILLVCMLPLLYSNMVANNKKSLMGAFVPSFIAFTPILILVVSSITENPTHDPYAIFLAVMLLLVLLFMIGVLIYVLVTTMSTEQPPSAEVRRDMQYASVKRLLDPDTPGAYWRSKHMPEIVEEEEEDEEKDDMSGLDKCLDCFGCYAPSFRNEFEPFETKEDFMYPQRFLAGVTIAAFFVTIAAAGACCLVYWFDYMLAVGTTTLIRAEVYVKRTQQEVDENLSAAQGGVGDESIKKTQFTLNTLTNSVLAAIPLDAIKGFKRSVFECGITAMVFSFLLAFVLFILIVRAYKANMFLLRRGQRHAVMADPPTAFKATEASNFIGTQVGLSVFSYFLNFFAIWFLLLLIFNYYVRTAVLRALLAYVLGLSAIWFISKIAKLLLEKVVTDKITILHKRIFDLVDMVLTVISVVNGIVLTVVRLVMGLGLSIIFLPRMDMPIVNKSLERLDPGFHSYCAMILLDHFFNSPANRVVGDMFVELFEQSRERLEELEPEEGTELEETSKLARAKAAVKGKIQGEELEKTQTAAQRFRNLLWVAVTLHNNPVLRRERKAAIRARLEEEMRKELQRLEEPDMFIVT